MKISPLSRDDTDRIRANEIVASVTIQPSGPVADFTGDGVVDFADFLIFAQGFGLASTDPAYDARLDLDGSGSVDFPDFLRFVQVFGTGGT